MKSKRRLRLKVSLPDGAPRIASVVSVWRAVEWLEREAFDMFGITFLEHPDLRRILLTPDWEGHPLRKDYPLRG
jgi:NADH-quinone oxidoreductase subunit C